MLDTRAKQQQPLEASGLLSSMRSSPALGTMTTADLAEDVQRRGNQGILVLRDPSAVFVSTPPSLTAKQATDCSVSVEEMEKGGQPSNKLEEVAQLGPALELTWKGKFEVPDFPGGGLSQIFAAHPASRVSRQAYNIASKMVGDLQFSIRPRHAFWPKIFKEKCPDNKDVAVYFYPQEDPRSAILQLLNENDLMLRSIFGGVELLVFSSSVLDPKYQKWEGDLFLWGVFRKPSRFGVTYYRRTKRIEV